MDNKTTLFFGMRGRYYMFVYVGLGPLAVTILLLLQRERGLNRNTCIWYVLVWGLKLYFYPSAGGYKKNRKKKEAVTSDRDEVYHQMLCVKSSCRWYHVVPVLLVCFKFRRLLCTAKGTKNCWSAGARVSERLHKIRIYIYLLEKIQIYFCCIFFLTRSDRCYSCIILGDAEYIIQYTTVLARASGTPCRMCTHSTPSMCTRTTYSFLPYVWYAAYIRFVEQQSGHCGMWMSITKCCYL